jgi:hypothetical protein
VGSVVALVALSMALGGAAVSASDGSSTAVITFDDAAQQAKLIIPTPACPASQPDCQWKFFLNEPKLSVDVATIYGTSGTLTLAYPKDFCGVIQADAYVGPPWVAKRGFQHTIADCTPSPTPTPTPPVPTPIALPSPPTPPTPPPPPGNSSGSVAGTSALPSTAPADAPPATSPDAAAATAHAAAGAPAGATPAQLPFTGANVTLLLWVGSALVLFSLGLLTTSQSRRRMARRLGDRPWPLSGAPSERR